MTGWISLHRSIQKHWLFEEKRKFSRFEAWIDILMMVNHTDNKIMHDGDLITVKRGQRITSLRQLGERWSWSITKVDKYLKILESDGMLDVKKDTKKTVLTVVNYDDYQDEDLKKRRRNDSEKTEKKHRSNTEKTQKKTNNNDNKENNENNDDNDVVVGDDFASIYNLYQENIEQVPSPITTEKLTQDIDHYGKELVAYAIKKAALNNSHNYKFIDYLLKDWRKRNLTTIKAVKQYEQQRQEQKEQTYKPRVVQSKEKTPDWLNDREQEQVTKVDPKLDKDREEFLRKLEENWGQQ
ncbi:DnaD domain protein [Staphylococcus epidermidis]|uniref:DnaD domain-containing protein n=1 Tax=Staphylococcus epidermidis TaxID=1282 RepID=UPI00290162BF|nr:DnaD domain protein [Staphylococcus epidermidis]MCG1303755.1 DnaD domain protein [Staphylococcus epidermidis]MCG1503562.1 DnaD domain protein [Staphylococcus epidermidis]MCG2290067.1 DnaD domain protein [Staphylococcus epidermidis]MCG2495213.1 DnaD domain protein [Staphylococcus epidermidis]MCG2517833.1 DnaD domain protein [Staphylococcus epidermidis]